MAINTVKHSSYGPIYNITEEKSDIVLDAAAKAGHRVTLVYGYNTTPDHNNKQCIDFMHYGNHAMRDWLVDYLIANKSRLGVEGIISNRRVMGFPSQGSMYRGPEGGWRHYTGPNPHTDHVHVQFNTRAVSGHSAPVHHDQPAKHHSGHARISKKAWHGKLWVIKKVNAYDGTGKRRPNHDLHKGTHIAGHVDKDPFGDGRYFRVGKKPHRFWYPLDSGNWSHSKNGVPIGSEPEAKHPPRGPKGQKTYVMYVTKNGTHSYAKPPAVGKVTHTRKKGFRVRGYPVRRSDGRYLRTLYGNDYPMDSLSHHKPK